MGRDFPFLFIRNGGMISIHSPRMGRDPLAVDHDFTDFTISIHSPRMGRDGAGAGYHGAGDDFNPLSPHGERPQGFAGRADARLISIHSPRMGRDALQRWPPPAPPKFQSTLPAWGETQPLRIGAKQIQDFNPLSPHGERQYDVMRKSEWYKISIHSPRMGRDVVIVYHTPLHNRFQSTLPAWGETKCNRI